MIYGSGHPFPCILRDFPFYAERNQREGDNAAIFSKSETRYPATHEQVRQLSSRSYPSLSSMISLLKQALPAVSLTGS